MAYLFLVRSYGAISSNMKNTLKIRLLFVLLVSVALLAAFAAQPDQRFDGVWVGTEGYYFLGGVGIGTGIVVSKNATVIIAQGGSMVAIVGGHFGKPQRFTGHWTKEGLTIYLGEGRTIENKTDHITFSLSADGKLVEKGSARFEQMGGYIYSNRQVASETFEGSFRRGTMADGARAIGK